MGKKKGSKRTNFIRLEDFKFENSNKREEIEASNHRNNKKDDVIKNQVEDKSECNKLLTEGTRLDVNDKTEKNNSLKNSLGHHKKNYDSDENTRKQNKLDIYKSICKTSADTNQSNIDTHKKQNHDSHLEESNCDKDSTSKKKENQNKSYFGNDKQFTSSKQHVEIKQDQTSSNSHKKSSSENSVPEPVGLNEKLAEESNSKKSNVSKKKKQKHNKDQQREDNFNLNKNMELNYNKQDRPSSIDRKRDKFVKGEKKSQFTGNNTDRQHSSTKDRHKDRSSVKDMRQSSTSKDRMCNLEEIDQDLFKLPYDVSLAHCVAEDLRMGAGIAVEFKRIFGGVGNLIDQNLKVGNVGRVNRHNQNVFYLITKKLSNRKPTMITMEQALRTLLSEMNKLNLKKLGIPKIGCGLDGLDWDNVKLLIKDIFAGSGIHIIVCVPSKILDCKASPPLSVFITPNNLWEMESKTLIIIPINLEEVENNILTNDVVDKVNARYPFKENLMKDLKNTKLKSGNIKSYCVKNENIICVFYQQSSYYSSLEKAFKEICSCFNFYIYFAIQSGLIKDNLEHLAWIVLILRSISHYNKAELWLCGDTEQTDIIRYEQYFRDLRNSENRVSNYHSSQTSYTL